jgi:hypothetical protein
MTIQVMRVEAVRQAAIVSLRNAVAAARSDPDSPFKNLYIPAHRFEKLDPKQAPFLHVVGKSDGGSGDSHGDPVIDSVGVLHINVLCACGRDNAADLDTQAMALAEAICLQLLEDSDFLRLFSWVTALRVTNEDGVARGDSGGGEYDVVLTQIELEFADGPIEFEVRLPPDATDFNSASVSAELGPVDESIPAQSLLVTETFPTNT